MEIEKLKNLTIGKATDQVLKLLPKASDETIVKLISVFERFAKNEKHKDIIKSIKDAFEKGHPSIKLARRILSLSENCRSKFVKNFIVNAIILGEQKRKNVMEKEGFMPPFFFVISPTMRCNLNCVGCYAGDYSKKDDLDFEIIDRILNEAKELGIYFITISGGEAFIRKDLLEIFKKHSDMFFLVYTNGQLINKGLAKKLAELGNVAPGISVEGFEEETDKRRGQNTHKKVLKAMEFLKNEGVLFGFSVTPTRHNSEIIMSDKFVDFYIDKGCYFGWYFQYIPIGKKPDVNLMATPEQRTMLRERVKEIRESKSIFIGDFWNDGPHVSGCMAGGKVYFHIVCSGDVEPCVFTHFAVDNIKEKSLKEVINSDFFKAIRKEQPYCANKNLLTPCMIIDNPEILRKVVSKCGARPTHPGADSIINSFKITRHLDKYSKKMKEITDPVWERDYVFNKKSRWYYKSEDYKKLGGGV